MEDKGFELYRAKKDEPYHQISVRLPDDIWEALSMVGFLQNRSSNLQPYFQQAVREILEDRAEAMIEVIDKQPQQTDRTQAQRKTFQKIIENREMYKDK